MNMRFDAFSHFLEKLEQTTSRNQMTKILADLFSEVSEKDIDKVVYLLQGRVAPLYVPLEFGMADKMVLKAISKAFGVDEKRALLIFKREGDLGKTAEVLRQEKKGKEKVSLAVSEVFDVLLEITGFSGEGSVEKKIARLADLLSSLDSLSNRFVARIPVGRLRLGFSDMTVLDALSFMLKGDKSARAEIEKAFNVRPDLGFIARTLKEKGLVGLLKIKPQVFTPILMARAERLSSGQEIIEKIGTCAVEPKVDGFRLQAHFKKNGKAKTVLFTRNLEDATFMYPDIVAGIEKQVRAKETIFEGEAIAYNPDTGEFLPFQETAQRKRKYGIKEKALELPLRFICFDVLFVDGRSFVSSSYEKRREALEKIVGKGDTLLVVEKKIASEAHEIENEFDYAVARGLEGIVAKRLDGVYQAGARGWNWIKFKRSYSARLSDTIDAVVMGYYKGQGKRASFGIGAFLIGVYDEKSDQYVTVAKIGTGLTDEEWRELHRRAEKIKTNKKPALYNVDKLLFPDVWVEPSIVVEIKADEITRSPVHTAGRVLKPSKTGEGQVVDVPGFALRFPRLERFRDDKRPEDVTTLSEIEEMEKKQK